MDITGILIAALASFVIGALWYSVLFGRAWRRLQGIAEGGKMTGMGRTLALGFLLDLLRAYVMIKVVAAMGAYSIGTGMQVGFWLWLGFIATIGLGEMLYERRPWKLFAITYGYHLVALLAMGGILAVW